MNLTENKSSSVQRCHPRWEDLRHGRQREQRGSSPWQHGDVWPLHQHLDSPAVASLPALQTRLRRHQKVYSERLIATRWRQIPAELRGFGTMGSLGLDQLISNLWIWSQHSITSLTCPTNTPLPPPKKNKKNQTCAECTHVHWLNHVSWWCLTSSTVSMCRGCSPSSDRHRDALSKTPRFSMKSSLFLLFFQDKFATCLILYWHSEAKAISGLHFWCLKGARFVGYIHVHKWPKSHDSAHHHSTNHLWSVWSNWNSSGLRENALCNWRLLQCQTRWPTPVARQYNPTPARFSQGDGLLEWGIL